MPEVPRIIHNVQVEQAMGIAPVERGYRSSKDNSLLHVVMRHAVVRGNRACDEKNTSGQNNKAHCVSSHATPPAFTCTHPIVLDWRCFALLYRSHGAHVSSM